jgi:hypothetical protein
MGGILDLARIKISLQAAAAGRFDLIELTTTISRFTIAYLCGINPLVNPCGV